MKKPIRLLVIVSSLRRSGPIIVVQNILRNIDRSIIDVDIVKLLEDDKTRSITAEFIEDGFRVHELNLSKLSVELNPRRAARMVEKIIAERGINIIHVHGYQAMQVATHMKIRLPIVETVHSILKEDYRGYGRLMGTYMLIRHLRGMRKDSTLVCISRSVQNFCEENVKNVPTQLIYNGVAVCKPISKIEARNKLALNSETKIFTIVGSLSDRKDPLTAIKAFKKAFPKGNEDVQLLLVGKGKLMDECKRLISDESRIKLVGWTSNVADYIAASDYTVCPSKSEGFGLNFIESVTAGVPVIGSDIDVFQEFYELYPVLGKLSFPVGNVGCLSDRLRMCYELNIEISNENEDALIRFSSTTMANNYTSLYKKVLGLT